MFVIQEHRDILKDLNYNAIRTNKLFMAEIDVTNSCNCKCTFCFQGNEHQNVGKILSFEKLISIMDELKSLGCYHLSFAGGEPFCRKDFTRLLKEAKKRGFLITFVSNLQLPSEEEIEQVIELGIAKVLVSFHSHNPKTYSQIFQVAEKYYWRALENIKHLAKSDTPVGVTVTVSENNATELQDILDMFVNIGILRNDVRFNMLLEGKNPVGDCRGEKELHEYLSHHQDLKTNILSKIRIDNLSFLCSAGRSSCVIRPNGDVLPCGLIDAVAGNVTDNSLEAIWNNSHVFKFIRSIEESHFTKCSSCKNLHICPVCIANNLNETGNYHEPSEEYCSFRKNISNAFSEEII